MQQASSIKDFINKGFATPISVDYANKGTIQNNLTVSEFEIDISDGKVDIRIKAKKNVILDHDNGIPYSKSVSRSGPYGEPLNFKGNIK